MSSRATPLAALRISDHALVRWLDRAGGLDVEVLRAALAQSLARAFAAGCAIEAGDFTILADGLAWVVRDGTVVTVTLQRTKRPRLRKRYR